MKTIELEVIKSKVETYMELDDISKNKRHKDYVVARYIYFSLATKYTDEIYANIAKLVNRDHATVAHCLPKIETYLDISHKYRKAYDRINLILSNPQYEADIQQNEKLRDIILDMEKTIFSLEKTNLKSYLLPIVETLNRIPEDQFEIVQTRIEAIVKMLPKPHQIRS